MESKSKHKTNSLDIILNSVTDNEQYNEGIYVIKRDGRRERIDLGKVAQRIRVLSKGLKVNPERSCGKLV